MDDRGVDDCPGGNLEPVRFKMAMHLFEYSRPQMVGFEKVAEAAHRGLVGHRLATQINANERPHRRRIIKRFFRRRVRQIEPVLQEVDPQHPLQPHRRATVSGLG